MKELNFNTGVVTYSLNGQYELSFNPTDSAFFLKLLDVFDILDEKQDAHQEELAERKADIDTIEDIRAVFDTAREKDKEMRSAIDSVLGEGTCAAVFGTMNVYAYSDGLPVWANMLWAIIEESYKALSKEQQQSVQRVEKYRKKYNF